MRRLGHFGRIMVLWIVSSAIAMTLAAIFLTPILPPGTGSAEATGQRSDNEVLLLVSIFVCALIFSYFGYVLVVFRTRDRSGTTDGPPIRGHVAAQTTWIVATSGIVLFLAAFGTYELLGGAGGGQGPNPVFRSFSSDQLQGRRGDPPLQVQVIAQQWQFTFRYPDEGGFESSHLVLPLDRQVKLHVTSLDAIHSFWVPALGVKADANPGVDNIAYVTPTHLGAVHIQCAELCGLFHGYMFDTGRIVSETAFVSWAKRERQFVSPVARYLPRYNNVYLPAPAFRAG